MLRGWTKWIVWPSTKRWSSSASRSPRRTLDFGLEEKTLRGCLGFLKGRRKRYAVKGSQHRKPGMWNCSLWRFGDAWKFRKRMTRLTRLSNITSLRLASTFWLSCLETIYKSLALCQGCRLQVWWTGYLFGFFIFMSTTTLGEVGCRFISSSKWFIGESHTQCSKWILGLQ